MMTAEGNQNANEAEAAKLAGNALLAKGDLVEAAKQYMHAISLDPTVPVYFNNAATAYHRLGDHERSIEMSSEAIRLDPSFTKVLFSDYSIHPAP